MWITKLALVFACTLLCAQPAAPPAARAMMPPLQPGESLAVAGPDGVVHLFGPDPSLESPMGSLAKLVWIKLEGMEWASMDVRFNCTGTWQGYHCWNPKGHGKEDLALALQNSCNLAFLCWGQYSANQWRQDYGDGAGRARLEDAFGPFLGNRMPPGETIPPITPDWVGDGPLLRTSPEAMLNWLLDPAQDETLRRVKRLLIPYDYFDKHPDAWWIKTGTAPVLGAEGATCAWAAGGNGQITAVLRLPRGRGKEDGLNRFRTIMMVPGK